MSVGSRGLHIEALDSATRLCCGLTGPVQYIATCRSSHACMQLHAMPTVIFIGIAVGRAEIPIETWLSSWEFKFSTQEKNSRKLHPYFRDKVRDIGQKTRFFIPFTLDPPVRRVPFKYCHNVLYGETRMVASWWWKKFDNIFCCFDRIPACDGWTFFLTAKSMLCIALHRN